MIWLDNSVFYSNLDLLLIVNMMVVCVGNSDCLGKVKEGKDED